MIEHRDFEPRPAAVGAVRTFVREALAGSPLQDDVVLVASELAANVVRHAQTAFTVSLAVEDSVRLEVSDGSSIIPALEELSESYRGLRLVEAAAAQWGIELTANGKKVWVDFPRIPPRTDA
jgi:hypothetical protein